MRTAAAVALVAIGVLTVQEAPAGHARAVVSRPGVILFSSYRTGTYENYLVRADGTGLKEMPPGFVSWAPNGSRLARRETTDDGADISVQGPDGAVHRLDTGGHVAGFTWSPDGTKIAYADSRPRQPMTVIDVRSGKKVVLPPGTAPQWSPDGNHIAFLRPTTSLSDSLWVVNPDGSHRRLLALGVWHRVSWAPNGKHLAFEGLDDLWTVNVNGSALTKITSWFGSLADLSWSPDGTRFAYMSRDGTDAQGRYRFSVFLTEPDGIPERRLVQDAYVRPIWSPAGNEIALVGDEFAKKWNGLFVVRPNGRGLRKILSGDTYSANWSEDGRRLVAAAGQDIWVVDIAGHGRRVSEGSHYGYDNSGGVWLPRGTPDSLLPGTPVSWSLPSDSVVTAELLEAPAPVAYLVADGSKVAMGYDTSRFGYPTHPIRWCLETWDTASGNLTRFAETQCVKPAYCCSLGAYGMGDFAFDGDRLSWIRLDHFAGRDLIGLDTVTSDAPAPRRLSFCDSGCVFDVESGGSLTVFDAWYQSCTNPSYPMPCAFAPRKFDKLYRVDGDRYVQIATSPSALAPLSVDGGRVLVDHQNGTLEILASTGTSLGTFHYEPGDFLGAKLQRNDVVVLTQGFLDDYAADSGALLHQWPLVAGAPRLEGVHGGVAVYVSGPFVYVVRLADGRTVALPQLGKNPQAAISEAGLFYAYEVNDPSYRGRVSLIRLGALPFAYNRPRDTAGQPRLSLAAGSGTATI